MPVQNYDPVRFQRQFQGYFGTRLPHETDGVVHRDVFRFRFRNPGAYDPMWVYSVEEAEYETINRRSWAENIPLDQLAELSQDLSHTWRLGWVHDMEVLRRHMEPDELLDSTKGNEFGQNISPGETPTPLGEQQEQIAKVYKMPNYRVDRRHKYNVHLRLRPRGDLEAPPTYTTAAIYPTVMLEDEWGDPVSSDAENYKHLWLEFGPTAFKWLTEQGEKNTDAAFDVMLPTLDKTLVLYVGVLERRELARGPDGTGAKGWYYDISPSREILELLHDGVVSEDLAMETTPPGMDPFLAVLRRGQPV